LGEEEQSHALGSWVFGALLQKGSLHNYIDDDGDEGCLAEDCNNKLLNTTDLYSKTSYMVLSF